MKYNNHFHQNFIVIDGFINSRYGLRWKSFIGKNYFIIYTDTKIRQFSKIVSSLNHLYGQIELIYLICKKVCYDEFFLLNQMEKFQDTSQDLKIQKLLSPVGPKATWFWARKSSIRLKTISPTRLYLKLSRIL